MTSFDLLMRTDETRFVEQHIKAAGNFQQVDAYRKNAATIRLRVIDERFQGLKHFERVNMVDPFIAQLPEETQADILALYLFTQHEAFFRDPDGSATYLKNLQFENPWCDTEFQRSVHLWMQKCFGDGVAVDVPERCCRFLEEALKLVQSLSLSEDHAIQLVKYVYGRPAGDMPQEIGGVMVTLAALCNAVGRSMDEESYAEIGRCHENIEKIRAKQAAKVHGSPLPGEVKEAT